MYCLKFINISTILLIFFSCSAQKNNQTKNTVASKESLLNYDTLYKSEMALYYLGDSMVKGNTQITRINALREFIPLLVKTLKIEGSHLYPFDSLKFMKILEPTDKSFRLYNWLLTFNDKTYRYYGAIHHLNKKEFTLTPLRDNKDNIDTLLDYAVLNKETWYGSLYYKIVETKYKRQKYYTLIGWDGDVGVTNRKVLDVLTFDKDDQPIFGAPIFYDTPEDEEINDLLLNEKPTKPLKNRIVYYFAEDAIMFLDYNTKAKLLVADHLGPPHPSAKGRFFLYVPTGSYNYFKWEKGKWVKYYDLFDTYKGELE